MVGPTRRASDRRSSTMTGGCDRGAVTPAAGLLLQNQSYFGALRGRPRRLIESLGQRTEGAQAVEVHGRSATEGRRPGRPRDGQIPFEVLDPVLGLAAPAVPVEDLGGSAAPFVTT